MNRSTPSRISGTGRQGPGGGPGFASRHRTCPPYQVKAVASLASARLEGGLGLLADATQAIRAGAELYAEVPLSPSPLWSLGRDTPSVAAGPTVSVTEGPFWITAGGLAGLGARRAYDAELHLAWGVEL